MFPTTTKIVATALAVASLGFAGTAYAAEYEPAQADQAAPAQVDQPAPAQADQAQPEQADEGQPEQAPEENIAIGEPAPGTVPPGTKVDPVDPEETPDEDVDYKSPEYLNSKEADDRYDRYCKMTDAEPSHSDKEFCADYDKAHGTGTGTDTGSSNGGSTDSSSSTGGSEGSTSSTDGSTDWNEGSYSHTKDTGYHKPVSYTPVQHSSGGSLPFTGLELWQLGLLAMVLIGGGVAARRLLTR